MKQKIVNFKETIKRDKTVFAVYLVLNLIVIAVGIRGVFINNYQQVFYCVLTMVLMLLPSFVERKFKLELPTGLEITVLAFIFAAEILGEISCYYMKIPFWDTILHTTNGFICAAIGFALVDILNRDDKIKFNLSPAFLAIVAFCFSMTVGVLWEFYEFAMDNLAGLDMQKDTVIDVIRSVDLNPAGENVPVIIENITNTTVNGIDLGINGYLDIGLYDTMEDLFVNFIGAVVFSFFGYFYIKKRGKGKIAKQFIPRIREEGENADDDI